MEDQTTQAKQTSERASQTVGAASDMFWDSWMQSIGMMTWAGDQGEKLVRSWMDQGRITRDEGLRLQREMVEQARNNQRELQELIVRTVQEQTEAFRNTTQQQMDEMRRRMDEINTELRSYRDRFAAKQG